MTNTTKDALARAVLGNLSADDLSLIADALLVMEDNCTEEAARERDEDNPDAEWIERHERKADASTALFERVCAALDAIR